jgi:hypothetical protein
LLLKKLPLSYGDGLLNLDEFIAFSNLMGDSLKAKYGGSYTLNKDQATKRFNCYDLDK